MNAQETQRLEKTSDAFISWCRQSDDHKLAGKLALIFLGTGAVAGELIGRGGTDAQMGEALRADLGKLHSILSELIPEIVMPSVARELAERAEALKKNMENATLETGIEGMRQLLQDAAAYAQDENSTDDSLLREALDHANTSFDVFMRRETPSLND